MSSRTVIWFRDLCVMSLSIYVVFSVASAPWSNLTPDEAAPITCASGCSPLIKFPDAGYYHYTDSIIFEWSPVSVQYRFTVIGEDDQIIYFDQNYTGINTATTQRLQPGNYTSNVYYRGLSGNVFDSDPIMRTENHFLSSASKITLIWSPVTVTYGFELRLHSGNEIFIVNQVEGLEGTTYEFLDFERGSVYSWSVYAVDSEGYKSEYSIPRELNIDTTKFLAFELFNEWEVPFLLLGVMMVIALQAGVFLAREEKDD